MYPHNMFAWTPNLPIETSYQKCMPGPDSFFSQEQHDVGCHQISKVKTNYVSNDGHFPPTTLEDDA